MLVSNGRGTHGDAEVKVGLTPPLILETLPPGFLLQDPFCVSVVLVLGVKVYFSPSTPLPARSLLSLTCAVRAFSCGMFA